MKILLQAYRILQKKSRFAENFLIFLEWPLTLVLDWCKLGATKGGDANLNPRFSHSMPDSLHEAVKNIAKEKGKTVTAIINEVMADYVGASDDPGFITEFRTRIETIEKELKELKGK